MAKVRLELGARAWSLLQVNELRSKSCLLSPPPLSWSSPPTGFCVLPWAHDRMIDLRGYNSKIAMRWMWIKKVSVEMALICFTLKFCAYFLFFFFSFSSSLCTVACAVASSSEFRLVSAASRYPVRIPSFLLSLLPRGVSGWVLCGWWQLTTDYGDWGLRYPWTGDALGQG